MIRKEIAQDFLRLAVPATSMEAFGKYADQHFKHHNADFPF